VERLVAFLALRRGAVSRSVVAGTLWMDAAEERAMANLRSMLWRARRVELAFVQAAGDQLSLAADVAVDLWQITDAASSWLDRSVLPEAPDLDRLTRSTDLLADWGEDWVVVEREYFRHLRLQALERLALEFAALGQFARGVETALAAVSTEPLRESAHRTLIAVHLAQGNRAEAIRQYGRYARLMRDELELEPSQEIVELIGGVSDSIVGRVMVSR
jgi:DNA-binding SARP family transcriptional activator